MKYTLIFEIFPPGVFGVPEEGKTVLPGIKGEYVSDTYYNKTMTRVGYGTLSKYRENNEAIKLDISLGEAKAKFNDNFLIIEMDAQTFDDAYQKVKKEIDNFLQHLALSQKRVFTYRNIMIEDENGVVVKVPDPITIVSTTTYNLEQFQVDLKEAERFCYLSDQKLEKAFQYYEQALLLYDMRGRITNVLSRHYTQIIASVYLNLWKAVTTILGDPSRDRDYKSRYKDIGLSYDYYVNKIKRLHRLRHNYDVAHYSLSQDKITEIDKEYGQNKEVVAEVIHHYREYVLNKTIADSMSKQ